MERRKWVEKEKEMEERVVQEQEEGQMKNLDKVETNYKYSRGLMRVQTHINNKEDKTGYSSTAYKIL